MAIVLIIKTEDGQTAELPIIGGVVSIGRSSSSDYKVTDSKMSGQHCKFSITVKGEVQLDDLGSTNGSFVNNSRVSNALIKIGDVVRAGNTLIKIFDNKLTASERRAIGYTTYNDKDEKTVPILSQNQMEKDNVGTEEAENVIKAAKKHVTLNKEHLKKKRPPVNDWKTPGENIIEQEESSGLTKMLKIESTQTRKKKA